MNPLIIVVRAQKNGTTYDFTLRESPRPIIRSLPATVAAQQAQDGPYAVFSHANADVGTWEWVVLHTRPDTRTKLSALITGSPLFYLFPRFYDTPTVSRYVRVISAQVTEQWVAGRARALYAHTLTLADVPEPA